MPLVTRARGPGACLAVVAVSLVGCNAVWGLDELPVDGGDGSGGSAAAATSGSTSTSTASSSASGGSCEVDGGLVYGGDFEEQTDINGWTCEVGELDWVETEDGCHAMEVAITDDDVYPFVQHQLAGEHEEGQCLHVTIRARRTTEYPVYVSLFVRGATDWWAPGELTLDPELDDLTFECTPPGGVWAISMFVTNSESVPDSEISIEVDSVSALSVDEECAPCQ